MTATPHSRARRVLAGALLCLPLAVGTTVPAAAAPAPAATSSHLPTPPTVTVDVTRHGIAGLPASLRADRYRFTIRTDEGFADLQLAKPAPGYSKAQFVRDVRSTSDAAWRRITHQVRFHGGAGTYSGPSLSFTETLYAGEYWAFTSLSDFRSSTDVRTLRVTGTPRASTFPATDGEVRVTDRRLVAPATLPRKGSLLVRNTGRREHMVALWRLEPGERVNSVRQRLPLSGATPVSFDGADAGLLSGGLQLVWSYDLPAGRYLLVDWNDVGPRSREVTLR